MVIRHYQFWRSLSELNCWLLISWRNGSSVITAGKPLIGCVAHPDAVSEFEKSLRKQGADVQAILVHD
jgi:hypothetical protein